LNQSNPSDVLPAGSRLEGYEIDTVLGRGVLGISYRARALDHGRLVVVQEYLPPNLAGRGEGGDVRPLAEPLAGSSAGPAAGLFRWGLERFLGQAQALGRLQCPGIVRVLGSFEAAQTGYAVSEYVDGVSLRAVIEGGDRLEQPALLRMLLALMDALEALHGAGLLHDAITPDHIHLRADGSPVLLGFGGARRALAIECRALAALVAPPYAPLESYALTHADDRRGPWTDIYALGACCYRAVTGIAPLDAVSRANAMLTGRFATQATAAELGRERYAPALLGAIDSALAFLPEYRPQSVAAWRAPLRVDAGPAARRQASAGPLAWEQRLPEAPAPRAPASASAPGRRKPVAAPPVAVPPVAAPRNTLPPGVALPAAKARAGRARATAAAAARRWLQRPRLVGLALAALGAALGVALLLGWWLAAARDESGRSQAVAAPPAGAEGAGAPLTAAQWRALPEGQPCLLAWAQQLGERWQLLGYGSEAALAAATAGVPAAARGLLEERVSPVAPSLCEVLEVYRAPWLASQGRADAAQLRAPVAGQRLREGDPLVVAVVAPAFDAYLYLDYFTLDGKVVHMVPGPRFAENRMLARATATIGELAQWRAAPPLGRELLVMAQTSQPLFTRERPEIEPAADYLRAVRDALQALQAARGASIDVSLVTIEVTRRR
jgi:hypothetical protein